MRNASSEYKKIMDRNIRNRAYVSVGLGVVNQMAQKGAKVTSGCVPWCNSDSIFSNNSDAKIYATMEENFFKMDGSMCFLPEQYSQQYSACAITEDILGAIRIDFDDFYSLKGLTIDFGDPYPTEFIVDSADISISYTNTETNFITEDEFGDTNYIIITPISMKGGKQRLRIYSISFGIGLMFSNSDVKDITVNDSVSTISSELPSQTVNINLYDKNNLFNVDSGNSYIEYLESMQNVTMSFGIELDDGTIEWSKYATLYLSNWDSVKGILSINASDRISFMEDEYTTGNKIYERTAYDEAASILTDAGLNESEYILDDYLKDTVLNNPMPALAHRECLQLLANACRCVLFQDEEGRVVIKANFANVLGPEDIEIETNGVADWSNPENIIYGTEYVYADMTKNFFKMDGSMFFLPENNSYLSTSYVSKQISNSLGLFGKEILCPSDAVFPSDSLYPISEVSVESDTYEDPKITIKLTAAYTYYGLTIKFDGNPPKKMEIVTYNGDELIQTTVHEGMTQITTLTQEFSNFDKMVIKFTEAEPYNRVLVNEIAFGELTEYVLKRDLMLENPHGYVEPRTKSVSVRIFSYELDENGEPYEISDNVYAKRILGKVGKNRICENQLISTEEHAVQVAEWLGNYFANNISYEVSYRGEPRIQAADIIKMESEVVNNLQVEVVGQTLKFNGSFSGNLELRRALRMVD